jgi:outer membrane protein assembly factor BamB
MNLVNNQIEKKTCSVIAIFLVLSVVIPLATLSTVNAHTPPWTIATFAFITVAPNPVGVNQQATIVWWINQPPPTAGGSGGDRWRNVTIDVTAPDGTKQTLGPFNSDDVGGSYTFYTPNQVGTYKLDMKFPGQILSLYGPTGEIAPSDSLSRGGVYVNDTYLPSSATTNLVVQQQQVESPISFPLPQSYWTRPIEGQNTDWYTIASNWLSAPQIVFRVQPDGSAPNTSHIKWTIPYEFGGVVGGTQTGSNGMTFYSGLNYEAKFQTPIIMNGRLYYEQPLSNNNRGGDYVCIDMETGEIIWKTDITGITFGQLFDYESLNQHGVVPNGYLWKSVTDAKNGGTVWMAYDPFTAKWLFNETNVPSGTQVYGPNGEILIYEMNYNARWLAMWNNTAAPELAGALGTGSSAYQWRPVGKNVNASTAYSWNVTIPSLNGLSSPSIIAVINEDMILGCSSTFTTNAVYGGTQNPYTFWALSLKPQTRGQLLWIKNYTAPDNNLTRTVYADPRWPLVDIETRMFLMRDTETMQNWGYSMDTGEVVWGPTSPEISALGFYFSTGGQLSAKTIAYGKFYQAGYGGILYCYDMKTGKLEWTYGNGGEGNSTYSGIATPYGNYPIGTGAIADGKVYLFTSEHSPTSPYWRGCKIRAVDAFSGKELWKIYGYTGVGSNNGMAVADGNLVYLNLYDMQLYCIGKGPSATTVDAPMTEIKLGENVLIRGSVTDIAAGSKQVEQAGLFPYGVPAVSDASMDEWMEYVYTEKPKPTEVIGVTVQLTATDPNGNFQDLGMTKTNDLGNFALAWNPPVPGLYTVKATFEGSESYFGSEAGTAFVVSKAGASPSVATPTPTSSLPSATPTTPSPYQTPILPSLTPAVNPPTSAEPTSTYIAISIAVVIVVVAAAVIVLKKRK